MWPTVSEPSAGIFVKEQVDDLLAEGVDIDVVSFDGRRDSREYLRAVPRIRRAAEAGSYDVVHAHYGLTGASCLLARVGPLITTFHGSDTGFKAWQLPISRHVARRSVPVLVDASAATRLRLQRPPSVVPMGVDTSTFRPRDKATIRNDLGWESDCAYAVFPGSRSSRVKNYPLFEATAAVVRTTSPSFRTVWLENLTRDAVADVLAAADVTIMTSHFEGSPVTVRESLASGTPVISVAVGDVATQLLGLSGCAVVEADATLLAAATLASLRTTPNPDVLVAAVVGRTDRKTIARQLVRVYADVKNGLRAA
jgi:glycosyltransferase involved in cell wall biosynthesis